MRLLLLLALMLPSAAALDALPDESRFAAHEARLVIRVNEGAVLHVTTDSPALASLDGENWAPTPSVLQVPPGRTWHGLPRTMELHLRRGDPAQETRIDIDDGGQTGATFAWPPVRETPALGAGVVMVALACLAIYKPHGKV